MKKLIVVLSVLAFAAPVRAGLYYSNDVSATSDTMRVAGVVTIADPASPYVPTITLNGVGGAAAFGNITLTSATFRAPATDIPNITIIPIVNNGIALRESDNGNDAITMKANTTGGFMALNQNGATKVSLSAVGDNYINSGNFGVGTASPGSLFTVSNDTFTVGSNGIVSAPSQPGVRASRGSNDTIPAWAWTPIYWGTNDWGPTNIGHSVTTSSDTFTIATGAGGRYFVNACLSLSGTITGAGQIEIYKNGGTVVTFSQPMAPGQTSPSLCVSDVVSFSAGDTFTIRANVANSGDVTVFGNTAFTYVTAYKLP